MRPFSKSLEINIAVYPALFTVTLHRYFDWSKIVSVVTLGYASLHAQCARDLRQSKAVEITDLPGMEDIEASLEFNELVDAGEAVRGVRSAQQLSTARKHFDKFLEQHYDGCATMETSPHQLISARLLGKFATYLFMNDLKLKTAQSYISQIKTYFLTKWAANTAWQLHPHNTTDKWYTDVREGLRKMCINRAIAKGEDLVSQAPPMYRDSLRQVSASLFFDNTASSLEGRDLLVLQWHCMGRAGETGIRHQLIRYMAPPTGALQVTVGRSKTSTVQCIHAVCDADSWEADVFHSLGCHLATSACIDDDFHFKNTSASAVNKILVHVFDKSDSTTTRFQSHSGRRGCASEALSNSGVSVTEVIARGGWAFDAVSKVFLYFAGVDRGDMRVGRAVAGRSNSDKGAIPPSSEGLSEEDKTLFTAFKFDLFRRALVYYEDSLLATLTASLIMYYKAVASAWEQQGGNDDCLIVKTMDQSIARIGGDRALLSRWSDLVRQRWLISNLPWLGIANADAVPVDIRATVTVDLFSFRDVIERQVLAQQMQSERLVQLQQHVESHGSKINTLEVKMDRIIAIAERLEVRLQQHQSVAHPVPTREVVLLPAPSHSTASRFTRKQRQAAPTVVEKLSGKYSAHGLHSKRVVQYRADCNRERFAPKDQACGVSCAGFLTSNMYAVSPSSSQRKLICGVVSGSTQQCGIR